MQIMLVVKLIGKVLVEHVKFLVICLCLGSSKKQNSVALSTVEAEYIAASNCCAQILWIKQQLSDFGVALHCIIFLSFVITQVPSISPRILFSTHTPSILRLGIISLEIMRLKVTYA